jgi:hypothetical protein
MRWLGFGLLLAGWLLVIAALILLDGAPAQVAFLLAGLAVEVLGLTFVVRSHLIPRRSRA